MAINFVTNNDVRTMKDLERSGNSCETKRHGTGMLVLSIDVGIH